MTEISPDRAPLPQGERVRSAELPTQWVADVACYWCGDRLAGCPVVGLAPTHVGIDAAKVPRLRWSEGRPRCERCGGPVYLDDIHPMPKTRRQTPLHGSHFTAAA